MSDLELKELTPEHGDELLRFFDGEGFPDNPHWASCYCFFYHFPKSTWDKRTAEQNRRDKRELIERGEASGVLAYREGKLIGWCHVARAATLPHVTKLITDPENTAAIVCYVVAPGQRRQGVATALLDAAEQAMKRRGLTRITAWPRSRPPKGGPKFSADALAYHGSLSMYLQAGFENLGEVDAGTTVVSKAL